MTKPASDTVLARIIHAVEAAQAQRAPPSALSTALRHLHAGCLRAGARCGVGKPAGLGLAVVDRDLTGAGAAGNRLPCALVISTPVTVVSGLAALRVAASSSRAVYLEQARKLSIVALDKTGTLTEGKPKLVAQLMRTQALPEDQVVRIARSLAARSDHPVAKAIAAGLAGEASTVQNFGAELGRGVHGSVDARTMCWATTAGFTSVANARPSLRRWMHEHEAQGRTPTVLANAQRCWLSSPLPTRPRGVHRQAISELKALGVWTVMLTGDNPSTAQNIAKQVGIDDVVPTLPRRTSRRRLKRLPPRARSGWSVMASTTLPASLRPHLASRWVAPAPIRRRKRRTLLIMNDDLRRVPETIRLSKKTYGALAEHLACAGHQGGVLRPGSVRQRHHSDGSVRGHGCEPAGGLQRLAAAAAPAATADPGIPSIYFSYAPLRRLLVCIAVAAPGILGCSCQLLRA